MGILYVVTTTTLIADLVRAIGGEYVNVKGLMGPGVDSQKVLVLRLKAQMKMLKYYTSNQLP